MKLSKEFMEKEKARQEEQARRVAVGYLHVEIDQLIDRRVRANKTLKGKQIPRKAITQIKGYLIDNWIQEVYKALEVKE